MLRFDLSLCVCESVWGRERELEGERERERVREGEAEGEIERKWELERELERERERESMWEIAGEKYQQYAEEMDNDRGRT